MNTPYENMSAFLRFYAGSIEFPLSHVIESIGTGIEHGVNSFNRCIYIPIHIVIHRTQSHVSQLCDLFIHGNV